MAKSISEINKKLSQLNKKYKESGLTDGKISHASALSATFKDKPKSKEQKVKISKAHIGKKLSSETIEKLKEKKTLFGTKDAWNKGKTDYKTKPHSEETKQKMRETALGKVITESQRKKASKANSVPIIATNLKSGKSKEYKSTKEAKEKLGLTGILHVLKGRSKQCGGYYFEYKK